MNDYESNLKSIFESLIQSPDFITLNALSERAGLSKRSVQNYIQKIDDWLLENDLPKTKIERKRGCGIRLNSTSEELEKLERLLSFNRLNIHCGDAKRRLDILKHLMFLENDATIQGFVSQYYVSRSTILSDLDWASQWLSQYKLRLFKTQRRGIEIIGDELNRRNAIAGFFDAYGHSTISCFDRPYLLRRIDEKNLNNLFEIYPRDTVLKIARIIEDAEREFDFILLDDFYTSLLVHMVISVLRITSGNYVSNEFLPPEETFSPLETETAEYIAQRIKKSLQVSLPPSEIAYICIHLVGYNAFRVDQGWGLPFSQKVERLAFSLIESVDRHLGSRYFHDKMLFFGLCLHLKTAVYRLKVTSYASKNRSIALSQDWFEIYEAVKASSGLYEQIFSVTADEEELLSLSCFFLLSQRRNSTCIQTLLVSNLGIIPRMHLLRDIEQSIPRIKIIDTCSPQQLIDWPNNGFTFIISTESLPHCTYPYVDLSSIPKKAYLATIDTYIQKEILYWQGGNAC